MVHFQRVSFMVCELHVIRKSSIFKKKYQKKVLRKENQKSLKHNTLCRNLLWLCTSFPDLHFINSAIGIPYTHNFVHFPNHFLNFHTNWNSSGKGST